MPDTKQPKQPKTTQKVVTNTETKKSVVNANLQANLESSIDGSMRLFGLPHQFIEMNDPRIGDKSNLGRCFAERMILEAPIICLKPGAPNFLPNQSDDVKKGFLNAIVEATNGNSLKDVFASLSSVTDESDAITYYTLEDRYSEMMAKVNALCKMMAVFLGISDKEVPWHPSATFGTYDWRYYSFKSIYGDKVFDKKPGTGGSIGAFVEDALNTVNDKLMSDTQWLRFYVDSNASFGESSSNSTTSSMLESFVEKLEGVSKELDTITGMTGMDVNGAVNTATSKVDSWIQSNFDGDGAISKLFRRISGNTKQIISGGNFIIPEIWSNSEYNKNYSFSITLSTPYGNTLSWYLNIGVPLCHILGLCLPQQLTANVYKSPYLVKCYSKGWFNCNYGIISGVNIDKGSDNSWNVGGLPNEIKVDLTVTDLYSTLSLPVKPYEDSATFLNTGMLEFLMVNCGIDVTQQDMSEKLKIWSTILANNFTDRFTSKPIQVQNYFKNKIQGLFNVI